MAKSITVSMLLRAASNVVVQYFRTPRRTHILVTNPFDDMPGIFSKSIKEKESKISLTMWFAAALI